MSIGSLGAGSGMDLEALVDKLVSAQRDAKVRIYQDKINEYEAELSALGKVSLAIEDFKSISQALNNEDLFTKRNAFINQEEGQESIAITTDNTAGNGSYSIAVEQLARGSRVMSATGTFSSSDEVITNQDAILTFQAGSNEFSIDVPADTTLSELRNLINSSEDNFGVSANLVDDGNGNLFYTVTSSIQGAGNSLAISSELASIEVDDSADASIEDVVEVYSGLTIDSVSTEGLFAGMYTPVGDESSNAIITVDGIQVTNDTNVFEDTVAGLSIEALEVSDGAKKVEISFDQQTVQQTIEEFIVAYNDLAYTFKENSAKGEVLNGNSLLRNLKNSLVNELTSTRSDAGDFTTIFDLGVKLGSDGILSFDSYKFEEAIKSGYADVAALFSGDGGLAESLENVLSSYTGAAGMTNALKDSIRSSISTTEDSLENYEERMIRYEESLRDKFTGLDSRLAGMNAQGNYLNSVLAKM
ncbi:flagellar filament capping protein FliD [Marinomonas sp. C2222]|uniref:Flagellar hook-associated protein 2 n=1 Tax=Marinomonas sargassi TaxID=2984494 RepID=A0ABT2YP16_9GAMM|nr:flagellar filament capping protein FliD [Marinomonas sargassi]MCV2401495.1 flagellar filament capping protein FliD [Marinomonas sargassi]